MKDEESFVLVQIMLMYINSVNDGKLFSTGESFQSERINLGKHVKQFEDGVNIGKTIRITWLMISIDHSQFNVRKMLKKVYRSRRHKFS